ncbi:MAG: 50S ribosomal protein L30e [Candidatus Micrarchaeota archaeon]|nr:50S ribosomal protein L30e [Candidatus Micrarchaeota archaeon]
MNEKRLKKAIEEGRVILGKKSVLRELKNGRLEAVIVAVNCPYSEDIKRYAKLSGVEIEEFPGTGKNLGTFCGKPFSVASIGIRREKP